MGPTGVYAAKKKSGETYYRASITYKSKHLSIGSFASREEASDAYREAAALLSQAACPDENVDELRIIDEYLSEGRTLGLDKWIMLKNFKDNGIYCRNPIYLKKRYFLYYLDAATVFKFDADDLFYYMNHKIMRRGGHLFVADYGMQVSILSRYGVKNHAVVGRDYRFVNGDMTDYRYENVEVINRYYGVSRKMVSGREVFQTKIHVNGDVMVGRYHSEVMAAIAYNKAADTLRMNGLKKRFNENFVEDISSREYLRIYKALKINEKIGK